MTNDGIKQPESILTKEKGGTAFTITGLNDNLEFMGRQLHVQTESGGFPSAHIVTQVFCKGKVVLSKKTDLLHGFREAANTAKIKEMMRTQHYQIIRDIAAKQARLLASR